MHKNTNATILVRLPAKFSAKFILIHIYKISFSAFEMMFSYTKYLGKVWRQETYLF